MDEELQDQDRSDSDEYSLEEESAKLQAEAQKVTRELEVILGPHRATPPREAPKQNDELFEEPPGDRPTLKFPQDTGERAGTAPPVPNWRRLNTVLSQHGFSGIPVKMGDNLDLVPDSTAVCDVILKLLAEREKRKPSLDAENIKSTQRLLAELNILRGEKSSLLEENEKLKYKLDSERKQMQDRIRETDSELKELERQNKVLKNKLDTASSLAKQRDQTVAELKSQLSEAHRSTGVDVRATQDREKAIFRKVFNREPGQGTLPDARVLSLIAMLEDSRGKAAPSRSTESPQGDLEARHKELFAQLQKLAQEKSKLESQKKILTEENLVLKTELQERPTTRQLASMQEQLATQENEGEAVEILKQVMSIIDIRNPHQLAMAVDRMQQVIRAVPSLEGFIKAVSAEVIPNYEDDRKSMATFMDEVIPTLRSWKHKLAYYDALAAFRNQLCTMLHLDPSPNTPDFEIIRAVKATHGGARELDYFKSLFEVAADEEVVKAMNQVFLFVHEMKALLQFSREVLRLDQSVPLASVLETIKYNLQR